MTPVNAAEKADVPHSITQQRSAPAVHSPANSTDPQAKLRKVFDDFVGQTFYGQMLAAMRSTVNKPAYLHGGRGEEVFQAQLDQVMAENMAEASASQFTEPLFQLFNLSRR